MSPQYQTDMSQVQKWGDVLPIGWYHIRIDKGEERESEKGFPTWWLWLKVQQEPFVGRNIMAMCSLQPHALALLKAFYVACGYEPGQEGHDPEKITGSECYVLGEHDVWEGQTRMKVPPYGVRSLQEGLPQGAKLVDTFEQVKV